MNGRPALGKQWRVRLGDHVVTMVHVRTPDGRVVEYERGRKLATTPKPCDREFLKYHVSHQEE